MLLSMTGFGEGRGESDTISVVAEVRSINNRHLKISYRSSEGYQGLEPRVEALIRKRVTRGTVQLNVRVQRCSATTDYRLNSEVLASYRDQLGAIDPENPPPISALLALPGVVTTPSGVEADHEAVWPTIEQAVAGALETLGAMRKEEGEALAQDLRNNCGIIAGELDGIVERSPLVAEEYRTRLHERVGQVIEKHGVALEPSDLVREVALFVDRSDISEEAVRLRSHLEQFETTVAKGENIGRKLEFIVQEMGRETNTIGSKSSDTEVSNRVVEIKAALERLREQVQNVE